MLDLTSLNFHLRLDHIFIQYFWMSYISDNHYRLIILHR
nr:MAG TPA: hypothetical protein [Bacteriophage sp.]